MKIRYLYSHLNGFEYLLVHKRELWDEIEEVINAIDADMYTKLSNAQNKQGRTLYDQKKLNLEFKTLFLSKGWKDHRQSYYFTPDEYLARNTMDLDKTQQKEEIEKAGKTPFAGFNQTDFLKENVAIEVQFGKYSFVAYDLFVKHMAFYIANNINVGIEILPTKALQSRMDTGVACYEKEVYNVYRSGRNTPAVPLVIIGIEPNTDEFDYTGEDNSSYWQLNMNSSE